MDGVKTGRLRLKLKCLKTKVRCNLLRSHLLKADGMKKAVADSIIEGA